MRLFEYFNSIFQIRFFFGFWFLKKFRNMETKELERIAKLMHSKSNKTLRNRIFIYGCRLVLKKNNYSSIIIHF